ncbi:hypothetical protein GCM10009819_15940 [Agromyces tropicus]|uniref:Uncharacterized protein n=1 Tax=Agromyces tropicus TaxID=555371 RepID=A0ABP5FU86_9MICO
MSRTVNERRGASRFETLLDVAGLAHHAVRGAGARLDDRVFTPDRGAVNRIIDDERTRATAYLAASL